MRNFKILLQYEGGRYQGWQKQESTDNTIQGKLEAILSKMCQRKVEVQGSGRTDSGVHAYGQVANFHIDTKQTPKQIMEYLNQYLPEDIGVISCEEVGERFHSRLNAIGKTYQYRVFRNAIPHVFDRRYSITVEEKLDVEKMRSAAKYLEGTHDFKAFTSTKKGKKSTIRTIRQILIEEVGDEIRFTFEGDGFLYHMVRILVGTLLQVGAKERLPEEIKDIFESGKRENAGPLVPSKGLALLQVHYKS